VITAEALDRLVDDVAPRAKVLREWLHRHPEPSNREYRTTEHIARSLAENGIDCGVREEGTGVWVDFGSPEPRIGFRADIDALPIDEPEDNEPRSENPGWMHACGHDAHAAIAFGICIALREIELPVGIRILFQPAEESLPGGALDLVADGLTDGMRSIIAFHVDPNLATGRMATRVGPITASADLFSVVIEGPGGHTARPHKTVDVIADAARLAHELPGALRRDIDARSALIVAFGSIHGGRQANVIPTTVELKGTVRTLDRSLWERLPVLVDRHVQDLMSGSAARCTLEYLQAVPPVVNDEATVDTVISSVVQSLGDGVMTIAEPSMGGEDFANYLTVVPGALFRIGSSGRGIDLHSSDFVIDDGAVDFGIRAGLAALTGLASRL
jgi:amidohydrolase